MFFNMQILAIIGLCFGLVAGLNFGMIMGRKSVIALSDEEFSKIVAKRQRKRGEVR